MQTALSNNVCKVIKVGEKFYTDLNRDRDEQEDGDEENYSLNLKVPGVIVDEMKRGLPARRTD